MDETSTVDEGARIPDEDIIHLLNTKKRKSREILSITNAAADAVSSRAQTRTKQILGEQYSNQNYAENKENTVSAHTSDSFVLSTSRDGSFSGQQRVRIPSRLLREIKSPLDRSSSGNVSSSESRSTSSGSLFPSHSSEHSSIQASGPVPTVIKYTTQASEQSQPNHSHSQGDTNRRKDTPIVIKYLQEYKSPNSNVSSINSSKSKNNQVETDDNSSAKLQGCASQRSPEISVERDTKDDPEIVVPEIRSLKTTQSSKKMEEPVKVKGAGLCQGAPSNNLSYHAESERGLVKAVSFSLSEKSKAARDMLTKRQEHCPAVRRVVQPKIIEEEPTRGEHRSSQQEETMSKGSSLTQDKNSENVTASQIPSGFEEQMKNLMNTLGAIESQCLESRVWQEKQQQELEQGIKQRDERRLQHLEDMQKHLVECQLKLAKTITVPPQQAITTTVGNTTQGLSTIHVTSTAPTQQPTPYPTLQTCSSQITSQNVVQGVSTSNPSYSYAPAVQHKTQPSFKTTVYSKPRVENQKSGVKRKFVRNTRTQTSPQYLSSVSSSDASSPLDTPLPRKRHPVPMTRDWKADREKKHVHFDTPDDKSTTNSGKYLKKRDAYPVVRRTDVEDQKNRQEQNLEESQHYRRPRTLVTPRSAQADYIVDDISRLRQELRDALNETEQTKLSLKNLDDRIHSQISSDESVVALPDHTRPYPLDAYLRATRDVPEGLSTPQLEKENETDPRPEVAAQEPGLCAYALSVLRDVQKQKENLEWNLLALSRRHDEQYLYNMVEDDETNSEVLRIRKNVAKKIEEIDAVVQAELLFEEQQRALENQVSVERSKPIKQGARSTHGVPLSTEKRAKLRTVGKENTQSRTKTAAKPKMTKPPPKLTAVKRPLEDAGYVSRTYEQPGHVPRRTTIKAEQTSRYQPTGTEKPKQTTTAARRKNISLQRLDESSSTVSEDHCPTTHRTKNRKPRYYFQPNAGADQSVIEAHFRDNHGPLPGQLLPMAIPLGKPKMDPALRLPLYLDEEESRQPQTVAVSCDVKQPNVAVITLKDEECLQDSGSCKKRKKSIPKKRALLTLEKQVLPNVDIDTSAFSEISSDVSAKETRVDEPMILPIPDPLPRPDATDYEEFKDYEHVRTLGDDQDSEKSSIHGEESVISLHGESRTDKPAYQGPPFPPRSIPMDMQDNEGDLRTPSETLEHKARELIEQELLARVVSEMAPPPPDPTSVMRRSQSSESLAHNSDTDEPDLAAVIGFRGIQLFVDAGIPVDTELVRNLIMEVLQEKVSSMLGYPKPQENISPAMQEPEDDYTDPESGSEDYSRVATPVRTPSAASQPESRPLSHVPTPEQTQSPDSISSSIPDDVIDKNVPIISSDRVITDEHNDEIEEGPLDDSVHKSPIATPVVTPSPPQSVMSLHTPQVSEQEQAESEQKSLVETPEVTVSIRDKTSTESPKDLEEDDLKEQTLVEDDDVEKDQETGADIPVIKFELEPEPSEAKVTNSPSSITTTTYSTQSTMGTVATDDEISEGEQLQPLVHVGQYSEGEFAPPSGIAGVENMTTLHEIPDDIFDSFHTSNKKSDLVKQAVHGLLKVDDISDEITKTSDENTSSEGQRRFPPVESLAQNVVQEDASEGEVAGGRDAVATLLTRIRQPVWRTRPQVPEDMQDTASVGQIEEKDAREGDLSPGEFATPDQKARVTEPLSMQMLDRRQTPSIWDSDENNNDSQQSSSINEVPNQTWDANIMITPKKVSVPFHQQQPYLSPTYAEQSPPANPELKTTFPRVVQVAEARHVSTSPEFSPSPERRRDPKEDDTMVTLSEIQTSSHVGHVPGHVSGPVSDHESDHVSDYVTPYYVSDQPARIQLKLPSADPSVSSVSLISEGILGSDESVGEILSISGGEI